MTDSKHEREPPKVYVSIYIILFILIVITAMALYDEDQKINRLKGTLYIITNRVDSLINEEHENESKGN